MDRRSFVIGASTAMAAASSNVLAGTRSLKIDTHAHVFTRNLPQVGGRYTVDYDAPIEQYIKMLDAQGMSHGVLIQPSFLGTDNSYLLASLKQYPSRLRGIAVLAPNIDELALMEMANSGIVGIRLNLIGKPDPDFASPIMQHHLDVITDMGWQVEVQAEAKRLPTILPPIMKRGVKVVIDHLGRPDPILGVRDPGFEYLLALASTLRVWVKLSGWYRLASGGFSDSLAAAAAESLLGAFGREHLLYGSDWPHTQFEKAATPTLARQHFEAWVVKSADRRSILGDTPSKLFGFNREQASSLAPPFKQALG